MGTRVDVRSVAVAITTAALCAGVFSCSGGELEGAQAEVVETSVELDLPPVPEFKLPTTNPDGTHPVAEMRLKGKSYLDTEVRVKGYIVWVYDCGTSIRTPDMSEKDLEKMLAEHPEKCSRPHMVLGEAANTPADRGVQVVEYPRPLRKDEKKALPDELVAEAEAAYQAMPLFEIGHEVIVTGKWSLTSPRGFKNSEGLLVYGAMENVTVPQPEGRGKQK